MINIRKQTKWYTDKADAINFAMVQLGFYKKPKVVFMAVDNFTTALRQLSKAMGLIKFPSQNKEGFVQYGWATVVYNHLNISIQTKILHIDNKNGIISTGKGYFKKDEFGIYRAYVDRRRTLEKNTK